MASLIKQKGRNVWQARIYDPRTGKQKSVSTGQTGKGKAEEVAIALELAMKGAVKRDTIVDAIDDIMGVDKNRLRVGLIDLMKTYLDDPYVSVKESTAKVVGRYVRRFVDWMAANMASIEFVDQVDKRVAVEYSDYLRDAVNTAKTFNLNRTALQTVFGAVGYRAGMDENPWKAVKNMKTADSTGGRTFTDDEVERLLKAAQGSEWYGACLMALYTGLRLNSIANLDWSEISGEFIRHRPEKTKRHGVEVIIPIHRKVATHLESIGSKKSGPVFPWLKKQNKNRDGKHRFCHILEKAGVDAGGAHLSFHCWRHTWRTRLSALGTEKEAVQRMGGWKTDISEVVYNHDLESLKRAIDGLE